MSRCATGGSLRQRDGSQRERPLAAVGACGCSRFSTTYVGVDGVALGRVVIYCDRVACDERQASVEGDKFVVRVPRERDEPLAVAPSVDAMPTLADNGATRAALAPQI